MSTELQYKFWDKEAKEMIDPNLINEKYNIRYYQELYMVDTERKDEDGYDYEMDVEFLRYTRAEDRNGKEICEGDVLKVPDLYETPENTETTYHNELVDFKGFCFRLGGNPLCENADYISDECEVIGNIYENPELIEV